MAGPTRNSIVGYASREQILSSDQVRQQKLASRDLQNILRDTSRSDEARNGSGSYPGVGADSQGDVINASRLLAELTFSGTFDSDITAGECFFDDPSITDPDSSTYQVVRWPAQSFAHSTPDGGNPRIDLIVAEPFTVNKEPLSRNILVDPVTRTVTTQIVNKLQDPEATLTLLAGTPAATPVPPAVPAGRIALFEVYVPAAAASSASFKGVRRVTRRVEYPLSSFHGILSGCTPTWSDVDEESVSSVISLETGSSVHRAVIDGEVLSFSGQAITAINDSVNPPSTAPSTNDAVFYIYLVGGRHSPQRDANGAPFRLVLSETAPDKYGHPTSLIGPSGATTQAGALYIGIGFLVINTGRIKPMYISGDCVYAASPRNLVEDTFALTAVANSFTNGVLATKPQPSTLVYLSVNHSSGGTAPFTLNVFPVNSNANISAAAFGAAAATNVPSSGTTSQWAGWVPIVPGSAQVRVWSATATAPTVQLMPIAYNMNVPRLALGAFHDNIS